jgi:hypothetical protein
MRMEIPEYLIVSVGRSARILQTAGIHWPAFVIAGLFREQPKVQLSGSG